MKYIISLLAVVAISVVAQTSSLSSKQPKPLTITDIEFAYTAGQVSGMQIANKLRNKLITSEEADRIFNSDGSNYLRRVRLSLEK